MILKNENTDGRAYWPCILRAYEEITFKDMSKFTILEGFYVNLSTSDPK